MFFAFLSLKMDIYSSFSDNISSLGRKIRLAPDLPLMEVSSVTEDQRTRPLRARRLNIKNFTLCYL